MFESFNFILHTIGLSPRIIKSSTLAKITDRSTRLIEWMRFCKASTYLLESHQVELLSAQIEQQTDIQLEIYKPVITPYHQQYNPFIPGLSAIDLLFNEGPQSKEFL